MSLSLALDSRNLFTSSALLASLSITVDHRSSLSMIPTSDRDTRDSCPGAHMKRRLSLCYYASYVILTRKQSASRAYPYTLHLRLYQRTPVPRPVIFAELVIPRHITPWFTHRYFFSSVFFSNRTPVSLRNALETRDTQLCSRYLRMPLFAIGQACNPVRVLSLMPKNIGHIYIYIYLFFSLDWPKRAHSSLSAVYMHVRALSVPRTCKIAFGLSRRKDFPSLSIFENLT